MNRLQEILQLHSHPEEGSPYWLARQQALGHPLFADIHQPADLARLGLMDPMEIRHLGVAAFVPRKFAGRRPLITAETGGASGLPQATAYFPEEFEAAFVTPFLEESRQARVLWNPSRHWLWIGPSGPHIIGKAARRIARETTCSDGFSVDFDPRWFRKLPAGSLGQARYLDHLLDQSLTVLNREAISYLFTTPVVLRHLQHHLKPAQRHQIEFLYLGGMAMSPEELADFATAFPNARRLAGYGNTLFGVCHQPVDGPLVYRVPGPRLAVRVIAADQTTVALGERGQVVMSRLDESCLLINLAERDSAVHLTSDALADPQPLPRPGLAISRGIY